MKTFSAYWTDKLGDAIKAASIDYPMEFHIESLDFQSFESTIAQGIDAHLECVKFEQSNGEHGRVKFTVSADTLHVLIHRLMESGNDNSENLASSICETIGIELI